MMLNDFPLFPEQASTMAPHTDALYIMLTVVTGAVTLLIFTAIFVLSIIYRRRPDNELAEEQEPPKVLEAAWIILPFIFFMATFVWGSWLYFELARSRQRPRHLRDRQAMDVEVPASERTARDQ